MTLKHTLETLDGLDEALKPLYKEINGKFILQVEDSGMKTALDKERKRADEAEARLKSQGGDIEEFQKWKEAQSQREADEARKRGEFEKLEQQLKEKHKEELKSLNDQLKTVKKERMSNFVTSEIASAIASAKGIPEILEPVISRNVRAVEKDGKLLLEVTDKDGQVRFKDSVGSPFTLSDLVQELRSNGTFGVAFAGVGATGAGSPPQTGMPMPHNNTQARFSELKGKAELTPQESLEFTKLGFALKAENENKPA